MYITDDIYRPSNANGSPIEQESSQLQVIVNGYTHKWYTECDLSYTANSATLNAQLWLRNYIFGKNNGTKQTLRFVAQISISSDFSTYTEVIQEAGGGASYYGGEFYVYARTANDGVNNSTKILHNRFNEAPGSGTFFGYYGVPKFNLQITNRQIWIRIKAQAKDGNNTWVNCSRGSGISIWKTFTTYAPFYQAITAPSHFYGNDLNTFTASIGANLISEIKDARMKKTSTSGYYYSLSIVRNEIAPYVTTGTATTHLYCWPYSTASDECTIYEFTLALYVVDPSDSNIRIMVASRKVTGSVEYKTTPDERSSIDGIPSWSITDHPDNVYSNYGLIIKNVMDTLVRTITVRPKYGRLINVYYKDINNNQKKAGINGEVTTVTISENVYSAHNSYCPVGIRITDGTNAIYDDITSVPVVNYFFPSFPIASIHRCDEDGSANDLGAYCRIDWAINVCPINNLNHKTLTINHSQGTTTYTNSELESYTQGGSLVVAANTENSYTITFSLTDDFNTATKSLRLSTAHVTMDWLYNGQGVAFGKVANQENAVEIAEDWKLICYNLLFSNIDMSKWLHQAESRVVALEQFVGNLSNTIGNVTQYQVSFYNQDGSELYDRQWIISGNNATDPIEAHRISTPEKESTTTDTFSFVGWSKYRNHTSPDATSPLLNITANKNIYAAFSSETRKYSVMWFNDSTLLETDSDLNYHSSQASYGGETPAKTGYTFGGWMPSGRYIESNENAMAQFFKDVEIEDSWEQILQAVDTGTAKSKYKPGNWKTLHTEEGDIPMRILYFNKDTLAGSKATAKITWLSKEYLWNHKIMNPTLQAPVTKTETVADWIRTLETGKYIYTSNIKRKRSSVYPGTVTLTLRCNGAGTLKIGYKYLSSYGTLVITVDGEEKYSGSGGSTSMNYIELTCTAGQTFAVELKAYYGNGSSFVAEGACEKVVEISGIGSSNSVTLVQQTISTRIKTTVDHFIEGSGAIGGWRASQLRAWLNNEFFNGIDPVVRNKIKAVNKCSLSYKADDTNDNGFSLVPNEITHDKIWVPSNSEVGGKFENENQGIDFLMSPGLSYGGLGYWRRTAYTYGNYDLTAADETHEYDSVRGVPRRFGSTYHAEDNQNVSLYFGFCT